MPTDSNPAIALERASADLDELVETVLAGADYRAISIDLVRWVGRQELGKYRKLKDAVKATRSRLHQIAAAYLEPRMTYDAWLAELAALPHDPQDERLMDFCRRVMQRHASTRERLPILDTFFKRTLAAIAPVHSVLDIGCGMNALAIPWMPVAADFTYIGLDVYTDQAVFLNAFLNHIRVPGMVQVHNVLNGLPFNAPHAQAALMLKTLSCLEQLEKNIADRLLPGLRAENLLITYPLHSLGGHSKGMRQNYQTHFDKLAVRMGWSAEGQEFPGELAFIVKL
jgi:16S rRNA (guanine(1405)-N(7))-methyltransferase